MKDQFVPYEECLELKELDFDEECFAGYQNGLLVYPSGTQNSTLYPHIYKKYSHSNKHIIKAPLWQQAFDWFKQEYNALPIIFNDDGDVEFNNICFNYEIRFITISFKQKQKSSVVGNYRYNTYEEARLACLKKLIELCKKKNY